MLGRDKAGGYGIQALGGMLVEYVHGDFLNVVGFPLNHFCKVLGTIYNSPPESPAHKLAREDSGETWPLVNSLSKCAENGEMEPADQDNGATSDAVSVTGNSASGIQEQNVVGPEAASESACSCNQEDFPHKIVDIMDGFKASKVRQRALTNCVGGPTRKLFPLTTYHHSMKAFVFCSVPPPMLIQLT